MPSAYGNDLILQDGDLVATVSGNIYTADDYQNARGESFRFDGYYNMVFSFSDALFTPLGEIPYHPEYGTRLPFLVGSPGSPETTEIIRQSVIQAAQFDPRVKSVDEVSVTYGTDNTAQVRAKITLFGKTGASEFVFPNFVIE